MGPTRTIGFSILPLTEIVPESTSNYVTPSYSTTTPCHTRTCHNTTYNYMSHHDTSPSSYATPRHNQVMTEHTMTCNMSLIALLVERSLRIRWNGGLNPSTYFELRLGHSRVHISLGCIKGPTARVCLPDWVSSISTFDNQDQTFSQKFLVLPI